ncbi:cleavage and polyadenylation specificity factor subunit 3 [Strigomonas culicis]|uniref:Cleavage and polyadenylation specificity factor subunit 3 n=1 Tax=Strigomonas culicis TaxID=28005 RepID=S9VGQ5_9TRYP|nr:cleavage and polyadenylation specificity factor subunit 3 [Strigomonas culicis]EPY27178.1 cleavage and polyadenylation specificity factor subunit 3 [Strigomonas culicis]|eukprot:EPY26156.1 cleavage and polyadenylation specificity factor subunit 3 [Strigomonas culicis]
MSYFHVLSGGGGNATGGAAAAGATPLNGPTVIDDVEIIPLGSGGEVGRSCVIVRYKGKTVMFDCGNHPAKSGLDSLPYFDSIKAEEVDLILITHFHLDHCGALPFFVNQTNFNKNLQKSHGDDRDGGGDAAADQGVFLSNNTGKIFMTSATKAFYRMVMNDFLRVGEGASDLVNAEWLLATMEHIHTIEYHEEKVINNIRFQAFNAGHVLGAAMFLIEINNVRILYTGDFSRVPDRHLLGAEIPMRSPDILIVESTNGIRELESREEREYNFTHKVHEVMKRDGKCLIPVFALGRAQELLLILEEFWEEHKELQHIPIYYASSLAAKCMKLYQTFVNAMNDRVKKQHAHHKNPFVFKFIHSLVDLKHNNSVNGANPLEDPGACVVLASPGMLQSGLSLKLFERWCGDRRNGIIMAGYCVDGTLAKEVLNKPKEVMSPDQKKMLTVRMGTIEAISFSAHSDGRQTRDFISELRELKHTVLVHGNANAMRQLNDKLTQDFRDRDMKVYSTTNEKAIRIPFDMERTAKIIGKLTTLHQHAAPGKSGPGPEEGGDREGRLSTNDPNEGEEDAPATRVKEGDFVSGVLLVGRSDQATIVHPDDVGLFTDLTITKVQQAMLLPLPRYKSALEILGVLQRYFAQSTMFENVDPVVETAAAGDRVTRIMVSPDVVVEIKNDLQADSLAASTAVSAPFLSQTVLSIIWNSSRYSDLLADVTCIALSKLAADPVLDGVAGGSAAHRHQQQEATLPVDISGQDKIFRLKCFHHMLSQFYPFVTTNLVTGACTVPLPDGQVAQINDCIDLEVELQVESSTQRHPLASGTKKLIVDYGSVEVAKLNNILKRIYLTLFPIPVDNGWCDCGMIHGEEPVAD